MNSATEALPGRKIARASVGSLGAGGEITEVLVRFRRQDEALAGVAIHDFHGLPFAGGGLGFWEFSHE